MKKTTLILAVFMFLASFAKAQTNSAKIAQNQLIINTWFEAPESSMGDTIVFKTFKHVFTANESKALDFSKLVFKNATDFSVEYWRWCPNADWAYDGIWSTLTSGKTQLDFGAGKCKTEMQIISVTKNELKAILK